jgi:hypothetical protein
MIFFLKKNLYRLFKTLTPPWMSVAKKYWWFLFHIIMGMHRVIAQVLALP